MKIFLISLTLFMALSEAKTESVPEPPTDGEVVYAIIQNGDIALAVDPTCQTAWPGLTVRTIGGYFGALVAAFDSKDFKGMRLEINATPEIWKKTGAPAWRCEVKFSINNEQDPWNYGIVFYMNTKDRSVIRDSFTCPGSS